MEGGVVNMLSVVVRTMYGVVVRTMYGVVVRTPLNNRHEWDTSRLPAHSRWRGPYVYTANNPLLFVDPDGKDLRLYINVILKDGTTVTVATNRVVKSLAFISSPHLSEGAEGSTSIYYTDLKQTITIDTRTTKPTVSVSKVEPDNDHRHSIVEPLENLVTKIADNSQEDGWHLTSAFADAVNGTDTKSKHRVGEINIDWIMAAVDAYGSTMPDIQTATGPAEFLKLEGDIKEAVKEKSVEKDLKDVKEAVVNTVNSLLNSTPEQKKVDSVFCKDCNQNVVKDKNTATDHPSTQKK